MATEKGEAVLPDVVKVSLRGRSDADVAQCAYRTARRVTSVTLLPSHR